MEDEDELDIQLRAPATVAGRCIILAALTRRLWIESLTETESEGDLTGEAFDVRAWLQTEGLWEHLTEPEVAFLERPVGRIDDDEVATATWQAEGLATLVWALQLSNLHPLGVSSDIELALQTVPSAWDQTSKWIRAAELQSETEIARERDRAEIAEWRVSVEAPLRGATGQDRTAYRQAIAEVVQEASAAGLTETIRQGDFTFGDMPVSAFNDQDLEQLAALTTERLRALNWLCGFGDTWDRVPLDV